MDKQPIITNCSFTDVPAMFELQNRCYTSELQESASSLQAKVIASPDTCYLVRKPTGISAYLITLPSRIDSLPILNDASYSVPVNPDLLYIHDLAVDPAARGLKLGDRLINQALSNARADGLASACLVAVQGSAPFWERFGFRVVSNLAPALMQKLSSYGDGAVFMAMELQTNDLKSFKMPSPSAA